MQLTGQAWTAFRSRHRPGRRGNRSWAIGTRNAASRPGIIVDAGQAPASNIYDGRDSAVDVSREAARHRLRDVQNPAGRTSLVSWPVRVCSGGVTSVRTGNLKKQ